MATKTFTYRGVTCTETTTTTDVRRAAFGRSYTTTARVWALSGRITKPAGRRPFLTSAAECRESIRLTDETAEYR